MQSGTPRPTREELLAMAGKTVPDVIAPGLKVLFVGINPGLYTAWTGHHFARPGNRFWRALYESGFTDVLLKPEEERKLLAWGYGITNLVKRASLGASDLSRQELSAGAAGLVEKVWFFRPRWVAVLGVEAFRRSFHRPRASIGPQPDKLTGTNTWLLPNPSGLNAHYTPKDLANLFRELRLAVEEA